MRLRLILGGFLVACGGDSGTGLDGGPDGSQGNDATMMMDVVQSMDGGGDDTGMGNDTGMGGDTGIMDAGTDTGPDSGTGISIWTCGTAMVADCSLCTGHTMPCVYCANMDASAISGVCVQPGTGCGNSAPMGYNLCPCTNDAGVCREQFQVCLGFGMGGGVCDTCGAVNMTNGLTCKSGGKCDAVDGGCI